jgi:hypothetical protein
MEKKVQGRADLETAEKDDDDCDVSEEEVEKPKTLSEMMADIKKDMVLQGQVEMVCTKAEIHAQAGKVFKATTEERMTCDCCGKKVPTEGDFYPMRVKAKELGHLGTGWALLFKFKWFMALIMTATSAFHFAPFIMMISTTLASAKYADEFDPWANISVIGFLVHEEDEKRKKTFLTISLLCAGFAAWF